MKRYVVIAGALGQEVLGCIRGLTDADISVGVSDNDPSFRLAQSERMEWLGSPGSWEQDVNDRCTVVVGSPLLRKKLSDNLSQRGASIGHHLSVGEFSVFSLYATLNGHCCLGPAVFLGAHATVTTPQTVGGFAKVAAGAVACEDVPQYALAFGNHARLWILYTPSAVRLNDANQETPC